MTARDFPLPQRLETVLARSRQTDVTPHETSAILTRATGFIDSFDYTLNPYRGCVFGCSYCYAAFFPSNQALRDTWGEWVQIKSNAMAKLERMRSNLLGKSVYMSTVTDPYQPIEHELQLVRELLPLMTRRGLELVVQTRSPLVTRDLDLLQEFPRVCVNMTVTTDSEEVRKAFEPKCPPVAARLEAIANVVAAGIPAVITMTPLLPIDNMDRFTSDLLATGVNRFAIQYFEPSRGLFVAGTGDRARTVADNMSWDLQAYRKIRDHLHCCLPALREGKAGFQASWLLQRHRGTRASDSGNRGEEINVTFPFSPGSNHERRGKRSVATNLASERSLHPFVSHGAKAPGNFIIPGF